MAEPLRRERDDDLLIERFGDERPRGARMDPLDYGHILRVRGKRIDGFPDGLGLDRSSVLAALASLRNEALCISQCDIVRVVFDAPEHVCETRHIDREMSELLPQYCRRSIHEAEEFIRGYPDPGDGSVLYVLKIAGVHDAFGPPPSDETLG